MPVKKGVCDLCGFADDSYRIDDDGNVLKVCKFCYDNYLANNGISPERDAPLKDMTLTIDLGDEALPEEENLEMKVEPLTEEELSAVLGTDDEDKKLLSDIERTAKRREARKRALAAAKEEEEIRKAKIREVVGAKMKEAKMALLGELDDEPEAQTPETKETPVEEPEQETADKQEPIDETSEQEATPSDEKTEEQSEQPEEEEPAEDEEEAEPEDETPESGEAEDEEEITPEETPEENTESGPKEEAVAIARREEENRANTEKSEDEAVNNKKKKDKAVFEAAHPKIDDERISITSPEVPLEKDLRLKTNLDVATKEYRNSVKFADAFKYVINKITYTIFLGIIALAVSVVLAIIKDWKVALFIFGCSLVAIGISFMFMWYLSSRMELDRRTYLLRIKQQEILFDSMGSECYRELRTKFTMLKALGWLLSKLSVILPLITLLAGAAGSVIACFLVACWWFPVIAAGTVLAAIIVYWIIKFLADLVTYKLDIERNQQITEQTLLDILKELKK